MKILHILSSRRFSGAENVVCQIISMFKGDNDIISAYSSPNGQIAQSLQEKGISFLPMKELSVTEVRRVITLFQPDVVHAHDMRTCYVASRACGRIPLICHIHNNNFENRRLSVKSIAFLLPAMKAKRIIYVSDSCYEGYFFNNWFKRKSTVLYNIIDVKETRRRMATDTSEYSYDVISLGRLSYPKNPQRLIHVVDLLRKQKANVKVAIIGNGELMEETILLHKSLSLENNVSFLGFQANPLKMLSCGKILLMTSRWEGTPMCALEAMALGVPIVSTPTDGLKVLVKDGENGFLSDTDEGLVSAIIRILDDGDLQARMSEQCKRDAEVFNDTFKYKQTIKDIYLK